MKTGWVLMVALCVGASAEQKAAVSYQITGTLVNSVDGVPIPHGHLIPSMVGRGRNTVRQFPAPGATFDTDERGHFNVVVSSAGAWHLSATARGFTTQAYMEHDGYSSAVVLTNEAPTADLRFELKPEASITGVVLDEAGEAVRRAQVSLVIVRPPGPDHAQPGASIRAVTQTDDRGMYEFAGLAPGSYRVSVRAQPWYAVAAQPRRQEAQSGDFVRPDPSLDMTYPVTWFPGVDDPATAETMTLHAGDTRQADFHLLPIPSIHLRIIPPQDSSPTSGRPVMSVPMVQMIGSGGAGGQGIFPVIQRNAAGEFDVSGLAPGLYQVRLGGGGRESQSTIVRVSNGQVQTVDMGAASNEAKVTVHVEGLRDSDARSVQVNLTDPDSGRDVIGLGPPPRLMNANFQRRENGTDRVIEVPPGQYEIALQGRPNVYLTGVSAKGAEAVGRLVTVPPGDSTLTVHAADGRATVTGVVKSEGKALVGAAVLLVPTTVGDPASIRTVRQDQSNTDGSFDLPEVIPGQYILIAIDRGWNVNWNDPSTLQHYLMQGVPMELTSGSNVKLNVVAQAP
jgi:Carboxypeptidase regulatory-like domain